jgi:hypothetical protein
LTSKLAPTVVTAITNAWPQPCYCTVTPGEIREFSIENGQAYPLPVFFYYFQVFHSFLKSCKD